MTASTSGEEAVLRVSDAGGAGLAETAAGVARAADVVTVGSTGVTAIEPLVTVTREGRTTVHTNCSPDDLSALASGLDDGLPTGAGDAVVEHDPTTTSFPRVDVPGLDTERRVLGGCGWRHPTDPDDHAGGFADADPETVRQAGETLRGRGWGDWTQDEPLAGAWETARETDGETAVVVNAHGTAADALLLASVPFEVLEGAAAVARAVAAEDVVVYVSADDESAAERVREAATNYPDPPATIEVVEGPPTYRAAEPTMAIEAIEGNHRLEARLRPPGPDAVGIDGRPTLVHTARTLAHLAAAVRAEDPPALPETRLVTVTGDVSDPVTVELPESGRLDSALDATETDGKLKAACVGGRFGGLTDSLDVAPDPEALTAAGLGTEGVVEVLGRDRCVVEFVGRRAQFAADENCGRCVPCREGTTQLAELLRDIYDGDYREGAIAELERVMRTTSICTFGVDAGRPVRTAMTAFGPEFEAHADGRCPAGACTETLEVSP